MGTIADGATTRRRRKRPPMSQINVTPFVDVMLVLLVIFMITAPLLTIGVELDLSDVELPEVDAPALTPDEVPLYLLVARNGAVTIQLGEDTEQVSVQELGPKLQAIAESQPDVVIYLYGDDQGRYGQVLEVLHSATTAGLTKYKLIGEPPKGIEAVDPPEGAPQTAADTPDRLAALPHQHRDR